MHMGALRARPTWALLLVLGSPFPAAGQILTLDQAVESALLTHPALAGALARADGAAETLEVARAARLPGALLSASVTRFQDPMVVAPLHSFDPTNPPSFDESLVQGRLGLQYTLFDSGERSSRVDGADAMAEAARYGAAATEMEILEQVAAAYVRVLATRAVRQATTAQLDAIEEEHSRALQQVDAGTVPELEALRAAASLQDVRAQAAAANARVGLAERSLARLIGVGPESVVTRSLADVSAARSGPGDDRVTNPVLARADRAVQAAEARVQEQRASRLPQLTLAAAVLDFGTTSGGHVAEWQAGLQVSWPVFTGGAGSAAIRRAEADLRATRSDLSATELQLAGQTDAAATAVLEADERTLALETSVTQWEEVTRIEALALEAGVGVQSDLLRAQAGLFQARAGYARARYDAVIARVSLARAQGVLDRNWLNNSLEIGR